MKKSKKRRFLNLEPCEARYLLSANAGEFDAFLNSVSSNNETAYLQQGLSGLQFVASQTDASQTTALFQQTHAGIPIHGAFISVVEDAHGMFDVFDRGYEQVNAGLNFPLAISHTQAEAIAGTELGARHALDSSSEVMLYQSGTHMKLVWSVATSTDHGDTSFTLVDANSGVVLNQSSLDLADQYLNNPETETGVYPRIVINNDIGPAGSRAYAASGLFDAVVQIGGCSGALIAPNVILSARHCGSGPGTQARFGDNSNTPDFTATVQTRFLPAGSGSLLDGGDVEILTLNQTVPASVATPMRLIDATDELEGMVAATVGYGYNGVGSSGHGFSGDGFRWGGENIIDVYGAPAAAGGSNIISTDFDNGTAAANTIGGSDPTPLEFEATTAPGDSGSPVMVQIGSEWVIAGVLSGGTTSNSVYGDISWWTGTAIFRDDIEARGGQFIGQEVGSVSFDAAEYADTQPVSITVVDANGINPVQVTVTSDSGDSETVTLADNGDTTYSATINADPGAVSSNDGTLQVTVGDTITVTYNDPDDGMGGTFTATATAEIIPPPPSTVNFDSDFYRDDDSIAISVFDVNGVNPLNVTVTSSNGDSETLTLTDNGDATYSTTVNAAAGSANVNDGVLQVVSGGSITVTYNDPNNGLGGSATYTDSANILAPSLDLIGIDFGAPGTSLVNNWLRISEGNGSNFNNLSDETGAPTVVDLTIQGGYLDFGATAAANTVPEHVNPLGNIDDQIYTNANPISFVWSDLNPGSDYQVYVFGLESFFSSIEQTITIQGAGAPISFEQRFNADQLQVNDQVGDSTRDLSEFAIIVEASASGSITIDADPIGGTSDVSFGGLAIGEIANEVVDGDFDDDGNWDTFDLDALAAEIIAGSNNLAFDLTGDGVLNLADRDAWLAEAGGINLGPGRVYLLGDANLDSFVDGIDFIAWNNNAFQTGGLWSGGDFNIDGTSDGLDFIIWNTTKFQSADSLVDDAGEDNDREDRLRFGFVDAIWADNFDA